MATHTKSTTMAAFVKSVIAWLSDFPQSPLQCGDPVDVLASRPVFVGLFECLLGQEISPNVDDQQMKSILGAHLQAKVPTRVVKQLRDLLVDIDFDHFLASRDPQLNVDVCVLLYYVGTHTSRYANLGITSLGFMGDEDKAAINLFIASHEAARMARAFDSFELMLSEEQRRLFVPLRAEADALLEQGSAPCALAQSLSSSYVDEAYLDSLVWEADVLEDTIYKLSRSRNV